MTEGADDGTSIRDLIRFKEGADNKSLMGEVARSGIVGAAGDGGSAAVRSAQLEVDFVDTRFKVGVGSGVGAKGEGNWPCPN